jgi:hypothetical protein
MSITEWRKLGEALPKVAYLCIGQEDEAVDAVYYAARRDHDRWQICDNPRCDVGWMGHTLDCVGGYIGVTEVVGHDDCMPCPSCGGSGLLPNQERLEQAADVFGEWLYRMHGTISSCDHHDETAQVVRAFDQNTQ